MPTCKECIHYEPCRKTIPSASICRFFKDRSKFIDVSELQQNVIRPLTNRCAEYTKCQMCLACVLEIRERCEHYEKAEQALRRREK